MASSLNVIDLTVDGQKVSLDIEADTAITDLSEDMEIIAPLIAWYGRVLASARRTAEKADDDFKVWKAKFMDNILAGDGKVSEWKAKAGQESHPHWAKHREECRALWEQVNRLDIALQALMVKADILRSKGAWERAELAATGMSTREERAPDRRRGKEEAARKVLKKGKEEREPADDDD